MARKEKALPNINNQSARAYKILLGEILKALSDRFGGETTLNQMRIGHYVGQESLYNGRKTNNSDISKTLNIPRSTVSRIITDCIENGWVIEESDPEDGRRKLLVIPDDHPEADGIEHDFRNLLSAFLDEYDSGRIVKLRGIKNGYSE